MIAPQLHFLTLTPEWATLSTGHQNLVDLLAPINAGLSSQTTTWEKLTELVKAV